VLSHTLKFAGLPWVEALISPMQIFIEYMFSSNQGDFSKFA
jgi:hypothetical protein